MDRWNAFFENVDLASQSGGGVRRIMYIESEEELRALYGFPEGRTREKGLSALEFHSINFISNSPFVVVSTHCKNGMADSSPRGGKAGFLKVIDKQCIVIPDAKGNRRLDSLVNIVHTGNIGCLFLIPGVDETLRVNGTARISTNQDFLDLFSEEENIPKTCIEVAVSEVFLHCAKALMRSRLWSPASLVERSTFPTMGQMLKDQLGSKGEPESRLDMIRRYESEL